MAKPPGAAEVVGAGAARCGAAPPTAIPSTPPPADPTLQATPPAQNAGSGRKQNNASEFPAAQALHEWLTHQAFAPTETARIRPQGSNHISIKPPRVAHCPCAGSGALPPATSGQ